MRAVIPDFYWGVLRLIPSGYCVKTLIYHSLKKHLPVKYIGTI